MNCDNDNGPRDLAKNSIASRLVSTTCRPLKGVNCAKFNYYYFFLNFTPKILKKLELFTLLNKDSSWSYFSLDFLRSVYMGPLLNNVVRICIFYFFNLRFGPYFSLLISIIYKGSHNIWSINMSGYFFFQSNITHTFFKK